MYPDFLIIGAQKAGTTWLHRNLRAHPGIWMPKEKELHYFDEKARVEPSILSRLRGDDPADKRWRRQAKRQLRAHRKTKFSLEDLAWDFKYFFQKPGDEWYASLFDGGRGKVTGEATPDYSILRPALIARAHRVMPNAKIILMVRNPIERAWSQALMDFERRRPLDSVPDGHFRRHFELRRVRLFSDYLGTLENWGAFYPEDRIFVGFLEDVNFAPDRMMERLYGFLGVDPAVGQQVIRKKIHTRSVQTIPTRHARVLAGIYREDLARLERHLGGYAPFWRYCAGQLAENPPQDETIPYPLWESHLWKDWLSETGLSEAEAHRTRSGTLSSLRVAA